MASNGPSPHSSSLRLGLTSHQPSRHHHTQSLLGPSFHDTSTPHVLRLRPERAAPLSRRDDERRHAVGSHSTLALCLYLAACKRAFSEKPSSPMHCPCQRLHPVNASHQDSDFYHGSTVASPRPVEPATDCYFGHGLLFW